MAEYATAKNLVFAHINSNLSHINYKNASKSNFANIVSISFSFFQEQLAKVQTEQKRLMMQESQRQTARPESRESRICIVQWLLWMTDRRHRRIAAISSSWKLPLLQWYKILTAYNNQFWIVLQHHREEVRNCIHSRMTLMSDSWRGSMMVWDNAVNPTC